MFYDDGERWTENYAGEGRSGAVPVTCFRMLLWDVLESVIKPRKRNSTLCFVWDSNHEALINTPG
jgi:hypothetical protein